MPRRVELQRPKEAVDLQVFEPAAPGDGEVRVRVEACALGQLDWNLLTLDAPPRLPLVPGHEAVGVVDARGPNTTLPEGTRVLLTPLVSSCGVCAPCRRGAPRFCPDARWRGAHHDGALSTHLVTPETGLVALPAGEAVRPEWLALAGGSVWTAVGAVRALGLTRPSRVAVVGVGGVGHLAVQVARALGHQVFISELDPDRQRLGFQLGGERLNTAVDGVVVCTPSVQALQKALRSVLPGGTVSVVGTSPSGRVDLSLAELTWRGVTLRGGVLGTREDLHDGLTWLRAGALTPSVEVVSLDDVPARLWALRDLGFTGRLVVTFGADQR